MVILTKFPIGIRYYGDLSNRTEYIPNWPLLWYTFSNQSISQPETFFSKTKQDVYKLN